MIIGARHSNRLRCCRRCWGAGGVAPPTPSSGGREVSAGGRECRECDGQPAASVKTLSSECELKKGRCAALLLLFVVIILLLFSVLPDFVGMTIITTVWITTDTENMELVSSLQEMRVTGRISSRTPRCNASKHKRKRHQVLLFYYRSLLYRWCVFRPFKIQRGCKTPSLTNTVEIAFFS